MEGLKNSVCPEGLISPLKGFADAGKDLNKKAPKLGMTMHSWVLSNSVRAVSNFSKSVIPTNLQGICHKSKSGGDTAHYS
jgi:hypothetical protein